MFHNIDLQPASQSRNNIHNSFLHRLADQKCAIFQLEHPRLLIDSICGGIGGLYDKSFLYFSVF